MASHVAVALKYARAVFAEAEEQGNLASVAAQLRSLRQVTRGHHELRDFMVSPEVPTETKLKLVQTAFGDRVEPLVLQFLSLLIEKHRMGIIEEIVEAFVQLMNEHEGLVKARVITAMPLDAAREAKLRGELSRITGKTVQVSQTVDPAIIGGIIVHLGNKIIDRSIRRGLRELRENLLQTELNEVKPA